MSQLPETRGVPQRWRSALGLHSLSAHAAWAGLRVMIGYQAVLEGADAWLLASLSAVFALPALVAAVPAGKVTDRWGGAIMASAGSVVVSLGLLMVIFLPGLSWLLVASVIMGLGNLMSMVGQQAFVAHISKAGRTDGSFGFLSATASAGQALGPTLTTLVASGFSLAALAPAAASPTVASAPDTNAGFWVCLAIVALGVPLYLPLRRAEKVWVPDAKVPTSEKTPAERINIKKVWPALLVSGLVLATLDMLYAFVPLWAVERDVSTLTVGLLLSLRALVSMACRLGLDFLVHRFGRRPLLVISTLAATAGLLLMPFVGAPGATVAMILIGVGLGIPQPLTMAWAVALTDPRRHGAVLGLRVGTNRLAQIVIPLSISSLAAAGGPAVVFVANAGFMAAASAVSYLRGADSDPSADEDPPNEEPAN